MARLFGVKIPSLVTNHRKKFSLWTINFAKNKNLKKQYVVWFYLEIPLDVVRARLEAKRCHRIDQSNFSLKMSKKPVAKTSKTEALKKKTNPKFTVQIDPKKDDKLNLTC